MKRIFLLAAFGLATTIALPSRAAYFSGNLTGNPVPKEDTILVKLANGAKMTLFVKNTEQLKSFQNYSLDSLMIMLNKYIAEADKMEKKDLNGKDFTVSFHPDEETGNEKAPERINITIKGKSENGQNGSSELNIDVNYDDNGKGMIIMSSGENGKSDTLSTDKPKKNRRVHTGFTIDLGFNTLLNTKDNMLDVVGIKPWGSRFVSLNYDIDTRVGGKKSPFYIHSGFNFAFNNYMFDRNYVLIDREIAGSPYSELVKDERQLDKSKLATSTVNIPLMAVFKFKNEKGKDGFKIGAGGFAGYRLGAHTKIKYQSEGDTKKDKDQGNYNLEDFQYGLKFTIGYGGWDLFANYNLNELFKDNRGPQANTLSFGISL